jgi:alkylhydroperoxidase/carboxymuconolactone decarboxylase family protein YurZ
MGYDGTLVQDYLRKTHETLLLSDREKHLIGLAVTLTRGCQVCTRNRIQKARAAGIEDSILNALVDAVAAVNAGVSAATARAGFRLADESLSEECGTLCSAEVSAGPARRPTARAEQR